MRKVLVHVDNEGECVTACHSVFHYDFEAEDIVQLEFPSGQPIRVPPSALSILAGYMPSGQPAYLAHAHSNSGCGWMSYCSVVEGMKPEETRPRSWRTEQIEVPDMVQLLALRYAPGSYPRRFGPDDFMAGLDDGVDSTGPSSWMFIGSLSRIEQVAE